ncbi:hypothetical protein EVAR_97200_1 [Eumeta japonica]|uniref:Uncharacterized protein n=1 Tax=Eumeta variegata TaxID=151549 RepID=A0A4C1WFR0_EUMVA|nr:hypothetical protein EVAR_97200_1 [Eumeta japonica]
MMLMIFTESKLMMKISIRNILEPFFRVHPLVYVIFIEMLHFFTKLTDRVNLILRGRQRLDRLHAGYVLEAGFHTELHQPGAKNKTRIQTDNGTEAETGIGNGNYGGELVRQAPGEVNARRSGPSLALCLPPAAALPGPATSRKRHPSFARSSDRGLMLKPPYG